MAISIVNCASSSRLRTNASWLRVELARMVGASILPRRRNWDHLRTSNPTESVFATVQGALSAKTAKLMVFKLVNAPAKTWLRLNDENQLPKVVQGVKFKNGIEVTEMPAHHAA